MTILSLRETTLVCPECCNRDPFLFRAETKIVNVWRNYFPQGHRITHQLIGWRCITCQYVIPLTEGE